MTTVSRRSLLLQSVAVVGLSGLAGGAIAHTARAADIKYGPSTSFSFDALIKRAKWLAKQEYKRTPVAAPQQIEALDYDAHWQIRFRKDQSLYPAARSAPVELFHPGRFFPEPVNIHEVSGGESRQVIYDRSFFDMPEDSPARHLPEDTGFAGFRVMRPGGKPDWISFLGASYFRADGPLGQYGLSARGLAINTGLAEPEEFPRFTDIWLGPPQEEGDTLTAWALLDGPSVTGAYQFGLRDKNDLPGQLVTVKCHIFMRKSVKRIGIAPLTSMYWYAERDRGQDHAHDWRPEIHDSDGLAIKTGHGERIWRALWNNHQGVETSSFFDENPDGFGLIQRDRNFEHYQDDGVFYNRRPSVWVEPQGNWGKGSVQLIEIPTHDETFDNIVAYWSPETTPEAGDELTYEYKLNWTDRDPQPEQVAHTHATYQGIGGAPGSDLPKGTDKMVVDFIGGPLDTLPDDSTVEPVIEARGGRILEPVAVRPVVGTKRWRLTFDFTADEGIDKIELRAYLKHGDKTLSETWITRASIDHS